MTRPTPRRHRPAMRQEYQITPPPRDGTTIVVPLRLAISIYWDDEMRRWVLVRPLHIETLSHDDLIYRWKRAR